MERGEIGNKLDPYYYKAEFRRNLQLLAKSAYPVYALGDIVEDIHYGAGIPPIYAKDGVLFIRAMNIRDGRFGLSDVVYLDESVHPDLHRYRLQEDNLVMVRSGVNVGDVCRVTAELAGSVNGSYSITFRVSGSNNPEYVSQFLNSSYGRLQIARVSGRSAQPNINSQEICGLQVVIPPRPIQDAIADKMDAAYRRKRELEAEAEALLESIDGYVLAKLGIKLPELADTQYFTQWARAIWGERLNPDYYHPERIAALEALSQGKYPLQPLKAVARFHKKSVAARQEASNTPYIGLEHIESNTGELIADDLPCGQDIESQASVFEVGNVLFPRLRPYLNKVHLAQFDGLCSTEFHVLQAREKCHKAYLKEFLLTSVVVNQTKHMMTGNTLPRLQTSDIKALQIPLPPSQVQDEIVKEAQARRERAQELRQEAARVITEAKAEVERMILGG